MVVGAGLGAVCTFELALRMQVTNDTKRCAVSRRCERPRVAVCQHFDLRKNFRSSWCMSIPTTCVNYFHMSGKGTLDFPLAAAIAMISSPPAFPAKISESQLHRHHFEREFVLLFTMTFSKYRANGHVVCDVLCQHLFRLFDIGLEDIRRRFPTQSV